jgi:hypothetical protein
MATRRDLDDLERRLAAAAREHDATHAAWAAADKVYRPVYEAYQEANRTYRSLLHQREEARYEPVHWATVAAGLKHSGYRLVKDYDYSLETHGTREVHVWPGGRAHPGEEAREATAKKITEVLEGRGYEVTRASREDGALTWLRVRKPKELEEEH